MERAEVSRRLKAARWLAGGVDEKGRPSPLSPEVLAARDPLVRNRITANAIGEIERMVKDARPMELRVIAEALGLPDAWFENVSLTRRVEAGEVAESLARLERLVTRRPGDEAPPAPADELLQLPEDVATTPRSTRRGDSEPAAGAA